MVLAFLQLDVHKEVANFSNVEVKLKISIRGEWYIPLALSLQLSAKKR